MNDLISRKAVLDMLNCAYSAWCTDDIRKAIEKITIAVNDLPSAQPERKKGKWLIRRGIADAQCSECKMYFRDVYDMENSDAFCRHCGTKMEGLKVVEDE